MQGTKTPEGMEDSLLTCTAAASLPLANTSRQQKRDFIIGEPVSPCDSSNFPTFLELWDLFSWSPIKPHKLQGWSAQQDLGLTTGNCYPKPGNFCLQKACGFQKFPSGSVCNTETHSWAWKAQGLPSWWAKVNVASAGMGTYLLLFKRARTTYVSLVGKGA